MPGCRMHRVIARLKELAPSNSRLLAIISKLAITAKSEERSHACDGCRISKCGRQLMRQGVMRACDCLGAASDHLLLLSAEKYARLRRYGCSVGLAGGISSDMLAAVTVTKAPEAV